MALCPKIFSCFHRRWMSKHPLPISPWPENYEKPFESRHEMKEARKTQEYSRKLSVSIKAAPIEASVSIFHDPIIHKFTSLIMQGGKRQTAIHLLNDICRHIKGIQLKKYHDANSEEEKNSIIIDPTTLIKMAITNTSPLMSTEQVLVGGAVYTVPIPISISKREFYGMTFLIKTIRNRNSKEEKFSIALANEIIDAAQGHGKVVAKKEELHRVCYTNRAYANYRRAK